MARPPIRPTRLLVAPATRRPSEVPDVSGELNRLGTRWEPALRYEDEQGWAWPERQTTGGTCSKGEHDREEKHCFLKPYFAGPRAAKKYGIAEGAYLAQCTGQSETPGKHPTDLIPVRDHRDAIEKARAFCACRDDGGDARGCAREVGGRPVLTDEAKKKRRR